MNETQTLLQEKTSEPDRAPLVLNRNNNVHLEIIRRILPEEYQKVSECGEKFIALKCKNKKCRKTNFFPIPCKRPICEYCGIRLRRRNFNKYLEILSQHRIARSIFDRGLRFLTLTVESSVSIEDAYRKITYYTWKLERSKWFKDHIFGGIGSTEFVFHKKGDPKINYETKEIIGYYENDSYHIHRHMIIDSSYIPMKHKEGQDSKFVKLWKKVTKGSCYVHVRRIKNLKKDLDYILKYSLKTVEDLPEEVCKEYFVFTKHKKLTFMIKGFRNYKLKSIKKPGNCIYCKKPELEFLSIISLSDYLRVTKEGLEYG